MRKKWFNSNVILIFSMMSVLTLAVPAAAKDFPTRPVKIVVYTKPGGAIDVFSRKFASIAERLSGEKFLIVNKPGAGGVIALKAVKKSRPDGLTIAAVTKSNVGKIVSSSASLKIDDFSWLAMMVRDPEAIIVNKKSGLDSWAKVVAAAKKDSDAQKWLGPAQGGNDHITAQKIWKATDLNAKWIPYAGGGKAMAALLGGHGAVYVGNPGDIIGKEDLKTIAISSEKRLEGPFADIPTFSEAGIQGLDNEIMWRGFLASKRLPAEAKKFYNDLFANVANDAEWKKYIEKRGARSVLETEEKFVEQVKADYEEFSSVVKSL